jgi:hypothetical protein
MAIRYVFHRDGADAWYHVSFSVHHVPDEIAFIQNRLKCAISLGRLVTDSLLAAD